jgi:hypothetical protein
MKIKINVILSKKIYFIKLKILKYIYLSIKLFFKHLIMHLVLKNVLWINTCTGLPKSRRPQAVLKTVTLFYIHCGYTIGL